MAPQPTNTDRGCWLGSKNHNTLAGDAGALPVAVNEFGRWVSKRSIMKKIVVVIAILAACFLASFIACAQPGLEISKLGNGQTQIIATNIGGAVYYVYFQTSTNLVSWTTIVTNHNTATGSCTNIFQTANSMMYYRLKL